MGGFSSKFVIVAAAAKQQELGHTTPVIPLPMAVAGRYLLACSVSISEWEHGFKSQLLCFPPSSLPRHLGKQQSIAPVWETLMGFQAPGFGPDQLWLFEII